MLKRLLKVLFILGWIPFVFELVVIFSAIAMDEPGYGINVLVLIYIYIYIFVLQIIQYVIYGSFSPFYLFKKVSTTNLEENSND